MTGSVTNSHRHGVSLPSLPLFTTKMSGSSSPDYKALFLKAEKERKQEAELRRQAEERERQAEQRERQRRERNRPTTLPEFIQHCHDLLWRPLRAQTPSRSTRQAKFLPLSENTVPYDCFRGLTVRLEICGASSPELDYIQVSFQTFWSTTSRKVQSSTVCIFIT